jgi:hypothetical protein
LFKVKLLTCPKKSSPFHWLGVILNLLKVSGYTWNPRDHPGGYGSVSRGMGGKEKKRVFSDFVMNAVLHREISKEESVKSFVSKCSKCSK